ncbi:MAG: hypothetical protein LBS37_07705 [Treponema sp.]|jgi:hypothetical protein|nr:hypothetical protein [Treponema sp.]
MFSRRRRFSFPLTRFLFLFSVFVSCGGTDPVQFPVRGTSAALAALSRNAAGGIIDFAKPEKLEYRFDTSLFIPSLSSLEIEYDFSVPPSTETAEQYQLVLETEGDSWALPMDLSFLGIDSGGAAGAAGVIHYAVPAGDSFSGSFNIYLSAADSGAKKNPPGGKALPRFQIRSLEIKKRWFGYYQADENGAVHCFTSPFVYRRSGAQETPQSYVIDPPGVFAVPGSPGPLPELSVELLPGREAAAVAGNLRFEASPYAAELRIPADFRPGAGPVIISGDRVKAFHLRYIAPQPFPAPITADPGLILAWPEEQWRDSRYELFRWEQFPSLLIFDTADYAVQDRLFKRLAFFTEKAGFRGRLAPDWEIADLHGWNAHDYRSEDLARFFEAARASNFPLLPEERELERILLDNGIIRSGGGISGGEGGIISISRESPAYLRSTFIVHESFHGLFFIDAEFRAFSRNRWENLSPPAKRFITAYFDYQHYDIEDEYLVVNEFMAHILQQPPSRASRYFGEILPSRLETSPRRRAALPEKDPVTGLRPVLAEVFAAEAAAFSAWVNRRWGLSAGRVRQVTVTEPAL